MPLSKQFKNSLRLEVCLKRLMPPFWCSKVIGAKSFDNFRPISLCNSFYKIISKVLTNRIIKILLVVNAPQQSGFILSRQILDSIMDVHEVIHSL